jgi:hypothetical protein
MVIHNCHRFWALVSPTKNDPPLVIDADRMPPLPLAFEGLRLPGGTAKSRSVPLPIFLSGEHKKVGAGPPANWGNLSPTLGMPGSLTWGSIRAQRRLAPTFLCSLAKRKPRVAPSSEISDHSALP